MWNVLVHQLLLSFAKKYNELICKNVEFLTTVVIKVATMKSMNGATRPCYVNQCLKVKYPLCFCARYVQFFTRRGHREENLHSVFTFY